MITSRLRTCSLVALLLVAGACRKHHAPPVAACWQELGFPLLPERAQPFGTAEEFRADYRGMTFDVMFSEYSEALQKQGYVAIPGEDERNPEYRSADFAKGGTSLQLFAGNGANDDEGSTIRCKWIKRAAN